MSLDLDPKEVLQHLHSLGYCNISPELLREFMRDLKKLIKYDQRKGLINRHRREELPRCCRQGNQVEMETDLNYGEDEEVQKPQRTYRRPSPRRHERPPYCDDESSDGSELSLEQNHQDARVQEGTRKENIPPRPPSSFIRPNIGGRNKPKSDPVALYHYYQGLWSQNPQPGEDPRSQLRWNIRHQMLGKQKPVAPKCGCPCCELGFISNRLPRKCPLSSRYSPRQERGQARPKDQTYDNFDPLACSSGEELNRGFNENQSTPVEANECGPNPQNGAIHCEEKSQQVTSSDPFCSKCGKRICDRLTTLDKGFEEADLNDVCDDKKNTVTVQGPSREEGEL